jgi:hypothetical protein
VIPSTASSTDRFFKVCGSTHRPHPRAAALQQNKSAQSLLGMLETLREACSSSAWAEELPDSYREGTDIQNPMMDPAKAEELKRLLRKLAGKQKPPVDLSDPKNKYTLWYDNGVQGYGCSIRAADEAEVYSNIRYLHPGVVILEINESGDRVTLWTCEVG